MANMANIYKVINRGVCTDYESLDVLLNEGLDANVAFHQALWAGLGKDYGLLAYLIGKGADVNSYGPASADYQTPLSQAILGANMGLVNFLLETGADVNQLTRRSGWFPLHCVCRFPQEVFDSIAKILLQHGADPNKYSPLNENIGGTPLEMARSRGLQVIVQMMENN